MTTHITLIVSEEGDEIILYAGDGTPVIWGGSLAVDITTGNGRRHTIKVTTCRHGKNTAATWLVPDTLADHITLTPAGALEITTKVHEISFPDPYRLR